MSKANLKLVSKPTPKIERGIKIPPVFHGPRASFWDFTKELNVNESFFLSNKQYNTANAVGSVRAYGYKYDMIFASRKYEDGIRVWRVK